jgi:zona occludens toxin
MITLITGLPGNGKTLYALTWLREKATKEGRDVYYSGIADLKLPWIEHDPQKWFELPKGSIIVIDEVQRVMRPRQHGTTVPEFVAKLETHRHLGVDLVLITQHPMLLDSNVRRLVGQHFHVVRKFGTHNATIHEWGSVKESCDKSREDSTPHHWRYPKDVFALYKSAEAHTHKMRIPMRVWIFLALPFVIGGLVWVLYGNLMGRTKLKEPGGAAGAPGQTVPGGAAPAGGARLKLTAAEYVKEHVPRVPGLAYTAPVYDEATKVTEAPYPAACVEMGKRCQCYTQQATKLEVPRELCQQIASGGFFVAWKGSVGAHSSERRVDGSGASEGYSVAQVPQAVGINGARNRVPSIAGDDAK